MMFESVQKIDITNEFKNEIGTKRDESMLSLIASGERTNPVTAGEFEREPT